EVDPRIAAIAPAQLLQGLLERREAGLTLRIVCGPAHEYADAPHALALLRARRERPHNGRAAEPRGELAALHSITESARATSLSGIWRPSVLAVLRLTTSTYLFGFCTGRSAGFSPLRMRSTYAAARR